MGEIGARERLVKLLLDVGMVELRPGAAGENGMQLVVDFDPTKVPQDPESRVLLDACLTASLPSGWNRFAVARTAAITVVLRPESCLTPVIYYDYAGGMFSTRLDPDELVPGDEVVLLADVCDDGQDLAEVVAALRYAKMRVAHAVVILDRQCDGQELLQSRGVSLHSMLTIETVVDVCEAQDYWTVAEVEAARQILLDDAMRRCMV